MDNSRKLNLGCGEDTRAGYINLDWIALPGVDVVHDINTLPLPFPDGHFAEILCNDVLEHVAYIPLLKELHRLLRPNGEIHIRVPHFTSRFAYIDPTHINYFSFQTFEFFADNARGSTAKGAYYFDFRFRHAASRIVFEKGIFVYNYLIEPLFNLHHMAGIIYEATFLSRLFPAQCIEVTLRK